MAVENHAVHEKTRESAGAVWGCWNLPRERKDLINKNGFKLIHEGRGVYSSIQMFKTTKDFGSVDCKNDVSLSDPKCVGCKWIGSGEANSEAVRQKAAL